MPGEQQQAQERAQAQVMPATEVNFVTPSKDYGFRPDYIPIEQVSLGLRMSTTLPAALMGLGNIAVGAILPGATVLIPVGVGIIALGTLFPNVVIQSSQFCHNTLQYCRNYFRIMLEDQPQVIPTNSLEDSEQFLAGRLNSPNLLTTARPENAMAIKQAIHDESSSYLLRAVKPFIEVLPIGATADTIITLANYFYSNKFNHSEDLARMGMSDAERTKFIETRNYFRASLMNSVSYGPEFGNIDDARIAQIIFLSSIVAKLNRSEGQTYSDRADSIADEQKDSLKIKLYSHLHRLIDSEPNNRQLELAALYGYRFTTSDDTNPIGMANPEQLENHSARITSSSQSTYPPVATTDTALTVTDELTVTHDRLDNVEIAVVAPDTTAALQNVGARGADDVARYGASDLAAGAHEELGVGATILTIIPPGSVLEINGSNGSTSGRITPLLNNTCRS